MALDSFEHLLEVIKNNSNPEANILLQAQDWIISSFPFDPVSNDPIELDFDYLIREIPSLDRYSTKIWTNDRLQNIIDFSSVAIFTLFDDLHEKNIREHIITNIQNIRETDGNTIKYLSKKPGRTIKQKIASDRKLLGVFHNSSLDTSENRLLKAFVKRLDELVYKKEMVLGYDSLSDEQKIFNNRIHRWLNSEEAELIGPWGNLPPNNTLLNDRNYRKIWKSWVYLLDLDNQIKRDIGNIKEIINEIALWELLREINKSDDTHLVQQPAYLNYETLRINLELKCINGFIKKGNNNWPLNIELLNNKLSIELAKQKNEISIPAITNLNQLLQWINEISDKYFKISDIRDYKTDELSKNEVSALDITSSIPFYSCRRASGRTPFMLVNQIWNMNNSKINVPCFYSKLLHTNSDIKNVSIKSFYSEDNGAAINDLMLTADIFAGKVANFLNTTKCLYLVPDSFDDFSPVQRCLRNSFNSHFIEAIPIPKSIAAVFNISILKKKYFSAGTDILVVDKYDDNWVITKIVAVHNQKLFEKNIRTFGIMFERYPSVVIPKAEAERVFCYEKDNYYGAKLFYKKECELLKGKLSIGSYHFTEQTSKGFLLSDFSDELDNYTKKKMEIIYIDNIDDGDNVTEGALLLEELQNISPEIPLWKDHLPPLYIKVEKDNGEETKVDLVDDNYHGAIQPKRGVSIPIEIQKKDFILPAGKQYYEFPLIQGNKINRKVPYYALLESDKFPLKIDTLCELHLTYTYGNEYPYELKFVAADSSAEMKYVSVQWKNDSRHNWKDELPVPDFPEELSWNDMTHFNSTRFTTSQNLIDIVDREIKKLDSWGWRKVKGIQTSRWDSQVYKVNLEYNSRDLEDVDNKYNELGGIYPVCYVNKNKKIEKFINCYLETTTKGRIKARECWQITPEMKFFLLTLWNNGHSLQDLTEDFFEFKERMKRTIEFAKNVVFYNAEMEDSQKNNLKDFLCILHNDMPKEMYDYLQDNYDTNGIPTRFFGNAIGNCTEAWQKKLFDLVLEGIGYYNTIGKSMGILSKCLWRSKNLIYNKISIDYVKRIINYIESLLKKVNFKRSQEKIEITAINVKADLEVLLALLRLRNNQAGIQNTDEDMLKLLSFRQNPCFESIYNSLKRIKKEIKDNEGIIEKKNILKSRLVFDITKSEDDETPDILLATMAYIRGNIESNSIRVRSMEEDE